MPEAYHLALEVPATVFYLTLARVVGDHGRIQLSVNGYLVYPLDVEIGQWIASTLATLGHATQYVWGQPMEGETWIPRRV